MKAIPRKWRCIGAAAVLGTFVATGLPLRADSIFDQNWTPPARPSTQPAPVSPAPAEAPVEHPAPVHRPVPQRPAPESQIPRPPAPVAPEEPVSIPNPAITPRPIPTAADQANSRKLLDEVYAGDMTDRAPAARRALAEKLLGDADKSVAVASDYYVLLMGARKSAIDGGDLTLAFRACDELAAAFNLNAIRMKLDAATKIDPTAALADTAKANCELALVLCDELMGIEAYGDAAHLERLLYVGSNSDPLLRASVDKKLREVELQGAAWERLSASMAVLQKSPDDPPANLAVGRFYCFVKGDWFHGLPMLAKGSDAAMKDLAKSDMAASADLDSQSGATMESIANGWWAFADQQSSALNKSQIQARSIYWYRQAFPHLEGLTKELAEKRAGIVSPIKAPAPAADHPPRYAFGQRVPDLPPSAVETDQLGGHGGGPFTHVSETAQPVVGFSYRLGSWGRKQVIAELLPIFDAGAAQNPGSQTVLARDGYVVAGVQDDADNTNTVAIRVIFARYKDGHVDMNDAYLSDWIGMTDRGRVVQLAGHGETVIGDFGRKGMNLDAMGLVVIPAK